MGQMEDLYPHPLPYGLPTVDQAIIYDFIRGALQRRGLVPTLIHLMSIPPESRTTGMDLVEHEYYIRIQVDSVMGLPEYGNIGKTTGYRTYGRAKTVMGAVDDMLRRVDIAQMEHEPAAVAT